MKKLISVFLTISIVVLFSFNVFAASSYTVGDQGIVCYLNLDSQYYNQYGNTYYADAYVTLPSSSDILGYSIQLDVYDSEGARVGSSVGGSNSSLSTQGYSQASYVRAYATFTVYYRDNSTGGQYTRRFRPQKLIVYK